MKRLDDKELVARIRENDEQAKEIMYRQYREEFLGWAFKSMFGITADEALAVYADACVAVWDNVIRRKYELIPGASFKTYLFRVAMHPQFFSQCLPCSRSKCAFGRTASDKGRC